MNRSRHPVSRDLNTRHLVLVEEDMDENLEEAAARYANHARAAGTRAAYAIKMAQFKEFCAQRGEPVCPAKSATVAQYIAKMADDGMSPSTVNQFLSALGEVHELEGLQAPRFNPEVRRVWTGIKRAKGTRAVGMKPILADIGHLEEAEANKFTVADLTGIGINIEDFYAVRRIVAALP